jgi:hypothetical protein
MPSTPQYPLEFCREAVRLLRTSGPTVPQLVDACVRMRALRDRQPARRDAVATRTPGGSRDA